MVLRFVGPLLVLALAGCHPLVTNDDLGQLDIAKPIHVDRIRVQYAAAFDPGKSELPYDEALRLETFLDQAGVRPNDSVFIASPAGDRLAGARAGRIATLLAQRSVGMVPVSAPPSGVAANHLLVLVDRYVATPPACPNWSGPPATGHDNVPGSDFGCATANDLAAMIVNPRDLTIGHEPGPANAEPALGAIVRYRTGAVKPLLSASQSGAAPGGAGASPAAGAAAPSAAGASPAAPGQ
jgi:pilus assembly protein CpaD